MKIERLEFTNFKCFPKLFLPQNEEESFPDGLFLIQGDTPYKSNSFGKSSLVEGILFAFFGPKILPLSINKLITFGEERGEVRLIFEVDGKKYLIQRSLTRNRKSGNHTSSFFIKVSGKWRPDDSINIESLLEIKKEQALRTVFVNQGEIESLANAKSAELRNLIISLFRLDIITHAEAYLKEEQDKIKVRFREIEKIFIPPHEIEENIQTTAGQIREKEGEFKGYQKEISLLEANISRLPKKETLEEISSLTRSFQNTETEIRVHERQIQQKIEKLEEDIDISIKSVNSLIKDKKASQSEVENSITDINENLTKINRQIEQNNGMIANITKSKDKLKTNIKFDDKKKDTKCPVCTKNITYEEAQSILKEYDQEISTINQKNEKLLPSKIKVKGELGDAQINLQDYINHITILDGILGLLNKIQGLEASFEETRQTYKGLLKGFGVSNEGELCKKYGVDSIDALRDKIVKLESDLESNIKFRVSIENDISGLNTTLANLKEKYKNMEQLLDEKDELERRNTHLEKNKELIKGFITEYMVEKRLLGNIQYSTNTYLNHFTGGQYNNLILVSVKVPRGSGLNIQVFDEYNQSVKEKAFLSGGDKVALGFALRIGISKLMNKIRPTKDSPKKNPKISILMLDEPLAALDTERRTQVLTTLESQKEFNQIFLITHTDIPENVNPHFIKISKNFNNGLSKAIYVHNEQNEVLK